MSDPRKTTWRWAGVTALGIVVGFIAVLLANVRFFYTDDTETQYVPFWLRVGQLLREGHFPTVAPEQWMSGNFAVEGEAGIYNPPQLLISFIAPSVDNLLVLATVVKFLYTLVLALGIFRICIEYGAKPQWAAVAGVAFPFSGWFLFLDLASWATSLAGTAWLAVTWAAAVRYARGRGGPIPVFVFAFFAITTGYIWPGLETILMIIAVAVGELVYQRKWFPSIRVALAAGFGVLAGAITYLPGILSSNVTWRDAEFVLKNDGFMTVPWSESLNASLPTTLPSFTSWFGLIQPMPMVYIAWFLIPGLAFIDWKAAAESAREVSAIAIFASIALMWAAGPAVIGPLRWPARVLPMLAMGLLILVCVLLSRHGTLRSLRSRCIAAGVLLGLLLLRTMSAAPSGRLWLHTGGAVVVAVLGAAVLFIAAKRTPTAACVALIVTIAPIAFYQVHAKVPHPMSWNIPERRSVAQAGFPDFTGTTIQLGDSLQFPNDAKDINGVYGSLVVGYYAGDLGLDYVNGYTPIGHYWFSQHLCMKWDGSVCPDARRRLFEKEPTTGKPLVDLMKLDRVVLQRLLYPDAIKDAPPPGWHWVDYPPHGKWIYVLERDGGPISSDNGRIADAQGVTATSVSESDPTSRARVTSENGGRVVFARLPWPGYSVTLDGRELDVHNVKDIFLAVDIPAGTKDGDLVVTFRPPGWKTGLAAAALGLSGIGVLQWLYVRRRKTDEAGNDSPAESKDLVPAS